MLATTLVAILTLGAAVAEAGFGSSLRLPRGHEPHRRVALSLVKRGAPEKKCKLRPASTKISHHSSTTSAAGSGPTGGGGGNNGKTIQVHSEQCPTIGATVKDTETSGPNGSQDWLNCGLTDNGGWNPPPIHISDLIMVDLDDALKQSGTPFTACNPFLKYFNEAASDYGIPAILLASIAMEESGCVANNVGGAGEQGIMQITNDKCPGGKPGDACRDPEYNIRTGAKYFADTLSQQGGNVALALGMYNGWYKGLTKEKATAPANTSCCWCQNNLDYIHQQFNGWILNIDPYSAGLGKYQNLKTCGSKNAVLFS